MSSTRARNVLPRWLKPANRLVVALQRLGMRTGTIHALTVRGRWSGKPRSTPVSALTVGGTRYIVGETTDMDWAQNARAAAWGVLAYGRRRERATLVELPVEERAAILREFPRLVPGVVSFFRWLYGLPDDPAALFDAFAGLATRATVFRVERAEPVR
jgi:hypothetical protein